MGSWSRKYTEKKNVFGWENFITALAYLFCLALPKSWLAMFCIPLFRPLYSEGRFRKDSVLIFCSPIIYHGPQQLFTEIWMKFGALWMPDQMQRRFDAHLRFFGTLATLWERSILILITIIVDLIVREQCMPPQLILFLLRSEAWKLAVWGGGRTLAFKLHMEWRKRGQISSINTHPYQPRGTWQSMHLPSMAIYNIPTKGHAASWRKNPVPPSLAG